MPWNIFVMRAALLIDGSPYDNRIHQVLLLKLVIHNPSNIGAKDHKPAKLIRGSSHNSGTAAVVLEGQLCTDLET